MTEKTDTLPDTIRDLFKPLPTLRVTYCGLIAHALGLGLGAIAGVAKYDSRRIEVVQNWHTASGVEVTLRDAMDGREYIVTIRPTKTIKPITLGGNTNEG